MQPGFAFSTSLSLCVYVTDIDNNVYPFSFLCETAFLIYVAISMSIVLALILYCEPLCGQTNILVYIGICSLMGSLTVSISEFSAELYIFSHFLFSKGFNFK